MPSFTQIPPLIMEISRHVKQMLTDSGHRTAGGQPSNIWGSLPTIFVTDIKISDLITLFMFIENINDEFCTVVCNMGVWWWCELSTVSTFLNMIVLCVSLADFRSLFAHSDTAVTSGEKSSINTNRKSTTCFPMSPRWTLCIVPKPPRGGGSKMQSVKNLNNKLW